MLKDKSVLEYIESFSQKVLEEMIKEDNLNIKLNLALCYANFLSSNFITNYSTKKFEDEIIKISNIIIKNQFNHTNNQSSRTLHVMTEAYNTGGHTRVVDNWIKFSEQINDVFFNNEKTIIPDFLKDTIIKNNGEIIINTFSNIIDKAIYLNKVSKNYSRIILHVHPKDIIPLLAFGADNYNVPIFLYNHADHTWGTNYSICDYILDLSSDGASFSNKYRGIPLDKIKIFSIPINFSTNVELESNVKKEYIKLVSMASEFKFNNIGKYNFQEFISIILEKNEKVHFEIIGVPKNSKLWRNIKIKYKNRLVLHGLKDKYFVNKILKDADIYIDSFPMNSYTSLLDAISLKIPVISLKTFTFTLDSLKEITKNSIDSILEEIDNILYLSNNEKRDLVETNILRVKNIHDKTAWIDNINSINSIDLHIPIKLQKTVHDEFIVNYSNFYNSILSKNKVNFRFLTKINKNIVFKIVKIILTSDFRLIKNTNITNKILKIFK